MSAASRRERASHPLPHNIQSTLRLSTKAAPPALSRGREPGPCPRGRHRGRGRQAV